MTETVTPTYIIEFLIGGTWNLAATIHSDDLAKAALRTFKRVSPAVTWRCRETELMAV